MSKKRIILDIAMIVSIIFLPYWVYLPAVLVAIIVLPLFWEGILLGFLIDALYGEGLFYSLWSLLLVALILPVRRYIRAYA